MCLGIPGRIVEILDEDLQLAKAEVSGVRRNINIGLVNGDDEVGHRAVEPDRNLSHRPPRQQVVDHSSDNTPGLHDPTRAIWTQAEGIALPHRAGRGQL